ncbi:hypothetical protein M0805_000960 [Coniferiporia weirii]|nr:hypothetical protein M0805_000960 [Coniferiporia weirii]
MTLFRRSSAVICYYCQSSVASSLASSSSSPSTFDPHFFRCPHCACWNRYDAWGQIIGDEPAMRDEQLNVDSFLKRGSPDRNHLPSLSGGPKSNADTSLFCHTCRTNQTLLVSLLAAYLPASSDPTYATRSAALPAYRAALHTRYPPVCMKCAPAVDAEIARRDEMARTRALGGALQVSNASIRKPGAHRTGGVNAGKRTGAGAGLVSWKVRGVLWTASLLFAILGNIAGILVVQMPIRLRMLTPALPMFALVSVAWAFWDPTYSIRQRSTIQGRQVRIEGRRTHVILQSYAWLSRLITSILLASAWLNPEWDYLHTHRMNTERPVYMSRRCLYFCGSLGLEIIVLVMSYFSITIHKPVPIRLINTSAHRALSPLSGSEPASAPSSQAPFTTSSVDFSMSNARGTPAVMSEPDLFATLSLSSNPIIEGATTVTSNPRFGQPSLVISSRDTSANWYPHKSPLKVTGNAYDNGDFDETETPRRARERDPDAMDWEPPSPSTAGRVATAKTNKNIDDGSWLRQQRFFPPEEPTGLEGLLMRTRLIDEDDAQMYSHELKRDPDPTNSAMILRWHWGWVYSVSILPVVVLLVGLWLGGRLRP